MDQPENEELLRFVSQEVLPSGSKDVLLVLAEEKKDYHLQIMPRTFSTSLLFFLSLFSSGFVFEVILNWPLTVHTFQDGFWSWMLYLFKGNSDDIAHGQWRRVNRCQQELGNQREWILTNGYGPGWKAGYNCHHTIEAKWSMTVSQQIHWCIFDASMSTDNCQ